MCSYTRPMEHQLNEDKRGRCVFAWKLMELSSGEGLLLQEIPTLSRLSTKPLRKRNPHFKLKAFIKRRVLDVWLEERSFKWNTPSFSSADNPFKCTVATTLCPPFTELYYSLIPADPSTRLHLEHLLNICCCFLILLLEHYHTNSIISFSSWELPISIHSHRATVLIIFTENFGT